MPCSLIMFMSQSSCGSIFFFLTFETENLRLDLLGLTNNLHGCFNSSSLHIVSCVFSSAVPVNANNGQSIVKKNNGWTIRYLIGGGGGLCKSPKKYRAKQL